MKRRIFAIVLSCLMVLSVLPVAAFAEEAECEHEFVDSVLREPTCEVEGVMKTACKYDCGLKATYTKIDVHPLREEYTVLKPATCAEAGLAKYSCKNCEYTIEKEIPATGDHDYVEDQIVDATCKADGMIGTLCSVCKAVKPGTTPEKYGDQLAHAWVLDTTLKGYKAADCVNDGVDTFKCSACGETKSEAVEALGHDMQFLEIRDGTCESVQVEVLKCSRCDYEDTIPTKIDGEEAPGHQWVEKEVVAPTCTEKGYTLMECSVCKETEKDKYTDMVEHATYEDVVAPTCKEEGYTLIKCKDCDYSVEKEDSRVDPDASLHTPVKDSVLREASCTQEGVVRLVCSECGERCGYDALPIKHNFVFDSLVAPTCTEDGKEISKCDKCGALDEEVIPASHIYVETVTTPATCAEPGVKTITCSREGCEYSDTVEIEATGEHNYVPKTIPATCTSPKLVGEACEVCNAPKGEMSKVGEALDHDWQSRLVNATCEHGSYEEVYCARECGEPSKKNSIDFEPALDHSFTVVKEEKAAACGVAGYKIMKCATCEATKTIEIEALEHDLEEITVDPTCVEDGYSYKACKREGCDYKTEQKVIETDGTKHNYEDKPLRKETCTVEGVYKKVCSLCSAYEYFSKPAGHDWVGTVTTPATCTEAGEKSFKCDVCGALPTEEDLKNLDTVVPALEHKYEEKNAKITTEPTCGKAGVLTTPCSNGCDVAKTEEIEATGKHTAPEIDQVEIYEADCLNGARVVVKCTVCGYVLEETLIKDSKPLDHDWGEYTEVAATCTEDGYKVAKCQREGCEAEYKQKTTDKLGHDWKDVTYDSTCTEKGKIVPTCDVCGVEDEENIEVLPVKPHEYKEVVTEATCAAAGKKEYLCVCGAADPDQSVVELPIEPDNHTYELDKVLREPSCTVTGVNKEKCKDCDATRYISLPVEHDFVQSVSKPATCTEPGVYVYTCACGATPTKAQIEELGLETVIEAKHTYGEWVVVEATCGKDGSRTRTCDKCPAGTPDKTQSEVIEATKKHNFEDVVLPQTCDKPQRSGTKCTICGEEGEFTNLPGSEPLGHLWEETYLDPDCTNPGRDVKYCTREGCGARVEVLVEEDAALGHNIAKFLASTAGTHRGLCTNCKTIVTENCTEGELKTIGGNCQASTKVIYDCTVCGKTNVKSDDGKKVPENHVYDVITTLRPATCTETGVTKFSCSCGDEDAYYYEEVLAPHTFGDELILDGPDGKVLATYHVCGVCGLEEILEAFEGYVCKNHPEDMIVVDEAVDATCDETGLTEGKHCGLCGTVLVKQEIVSKHNYVFVGDGLDADYNYVHIFECKDCHDKIEVIQ